MFLCFNSVSLISLFQGQKFTFSSFRLLSRERAQVAQFAHFLLQFALRREDVTLCSSPINTTTVDAPSLNTWLIDYICKAQICLRGETPAMWHLRRGATYMPPLLAAFHPNLYTVWGIGRWPSWMRAAREAERWHRSLSEPLACAVLWVWPSADPQKAFHGCGRNPIRARKRKTRGCWVRIKWQADSSSRLPDTVIRWVAGVGVTICYTSFLAHMLRHSLAPFLCTFWVLDWKGVMETPKCGGGPRLKCFLSHAINC